MNDEIQLIPAPAGTVLTIELVNKAEMTSTYRQLSVVAFELVDVGHPDDAHLTPWVLGGASAYRWEWSGSLGDDCELSMPGTPLEPDRIVRYRLGENGKTWIKIEEEEGEAEQTG
jgi:hypothetical protein